MHLNRRDFLSATAALGGMAALPALAGQPAPDWREAFEQPQGMARPWVRWWWPGGVVDDDELRREIGVLKTAGFGGAEIQAFNPAIPKLTKDERARLNDFANPAYFGHVKAVAGEALRQGLQIDCTFGSAWPSGGGFAVTPELALLELTPAITPVVAPLQGPLRLTMPANTKKFGTLSSLDARSKDPRAADWRARLAARQKLVAIVAVKGAAPTLENNKTYRSAVVKTAGLLEQAQGIVLTDKLGADGVLDWTPPSAGPWQIVVFKQFAVDSGVMAGVGEGPQLVLDHFNAAALAAHTGRVGQPLTAMGREKAGLRGNFIDSLELMPDLDWSEDLLAQFEARRGYDLTPYLPLILQPGWMESWNAHASPPYFDAGANGERIRADYRLTLSELLIDNFWRPFVAWNKANGFTSRVQAHGGPADLLQSYGLADIPETEDLESGGNTHFLRLARAAADLYGRQLVGCESLCWKGRAFETTPADWLARVNLLFASGVNAIVMHGFPYALHADAWPGWFPFAPSGFMDGFSSMLNEANPLWDGMAALNAYVGRTQAVLQQGRNVVPVCVYFGEIGYFHGIEPAATEQLLQGLLDDGYDYDRINDDAILRGRVAGGVLLAPGGARYSALVVPKRDGMRAATAARLATYAKAGLRIVFIDAAPDRDEGYLDHRQADERVRAALKTAMADGARIAAPARLTALLRQLGVPPNLSFDGPPCMFIEKARDGQTIYLLHNRGAQAMTVRLRTRAAGHPQRWDAADGSHTNIAARRIGGETAVQVHLEAGAATLLVFAPAKARRAERPTVAGATLDPGANGWSFSAKGHSLGGRVIAREAGPGTLGDWSGIDGMADFSGRGSYTTTFSLDKAWTTKNDRVQLDLGAVHDMARVTVNGKPYGPVLAPPYALDITDALRAGRNVLEVVVSNSPNNAMINPRLPGLKALTPKPAGLIGPVQLQRHHRKTDA